MERERYNDPAEPSDDTDSERGMAVYGETDIDPNREDQRSAHQAAPDEHL